MPSECMLRRGATSSGAANRLSRAIRANVYSTRFLHVTFAVFASSASLLLAGCATFASGCGAAPPSPFACRLEQGSPTRSSSRRPRAQQRPSTPAATSSNSRISNGHGPFPFGVRFCLPSIMRLTLAAWLRHPLALCFAAAQSSLHFELLQVTVPNKKAALSRVGQGGASSSLSWRSTRVSSPPSSPLSSRPHDEFPVNCNIT